MPRPRWGIVAAGIVVFVLVTMQILLPSFGERAIEDRLTENGGSADVTLGSVPAFRLLLGDGERFEVRAREIDLELDPEEKVLEQLDGFRTVDISIADSKAGPIELQDFALHRDGLGPYELVAHGNTSASQLIDYGVDGFDLPAAGSLTAMALDLFGLDTDIAVPIDFEMELVSDSDRLRVVSGDGSIGGVPTGTIAELITNAIVVKL